MDKTLVGLLGAVSALAVPAHAATAPPSNLSAVMEANSYADLLKPIPNASALLKEQAAAESQMKQAEPAAEGEATVLEVQYWYRHHHHHHHWYRRRWYHHHHHHYHHHHHNYYYRYHHHDS